jgi:hypothetical protein
MSSKSIWIGRAALGLVIAATLPLFIMGVGNIVARTSRCERQTQRGHSQ